MANSIAAEGDMPAEARTKKLPTWAQQLIQNLERKAHDAQAQLAAMQASQDKSDVWIEHGSTDADRQYIAEPFGSSGLHTTVVFHTATSSDPRQDTKISVRIKDGGVEVMATGYPHSLAIVPQASNVVKIKAVRA